MFAVVVNIILLIIYGIRIVLLDISRSEEIKLLLIWLIFGMLIQIYIQLI